IEAQVYEADQGMLHEGQTVSATTLALPNEVFTGKLTFIYPHLDESTRTLTARFELPNPGHKLRPGMYATVRIEVAPTDLNLVASDAKVKGNENNERLEKGQVLAIPENAVIDTGSLKVVYRESAPNPFEGVIVQLGPRMVDSESVSKIRPVTYYP